MRSHHLPFMLGAVIASACTGRGSSNSSGEDASTAPTPQQVESLRADLASHGFQVAIGAWNLFTIDDCKYAIASLGNCVGNNPAAPYLFPSVPLWQDEFVDEHMRNAFGPLPNDTWATYRLDPREAILILGRLPPPGAYFGLQTYVFSREGTINPADPIFQQTLADPVLHGLLFSTSPNPARVLAFSSIGNSNDDVVVERQSGAAFEELRYFIIASDAAVAREVTEGLVRAGVHDRDIFIEPVSPELVRVGLGEHADDLITFLRYAEPRDPAAGDLWREEPPLAVLRIRDMNTKRATEPYPIPAYDQKVARSELGLEADLADLIGAVKQQWSQTAAADGRFQSLQLSVDLVGQHCLGRPMNCLGDTQDTDYQVSPSVDIDSGQVIAVVGTLGTATGNATYVSLSVNRISVLMGVANVSGTALAGTASAFSGSVHDTDKFYVHYFARDCTGLPSCSTITEDLVPRGEQIKIVQRNYVVPGTARGADPTQVLNPVAITFDGSARPSIR